MVCEVESVSMAGTILITLSVLPITVHIFYVAHPSQTKIKYLFSNGGSGSRTEPTVQTLPSKF